MERVLAACDPGPVTTRALAGLGDLSDHACVLAMGKAATPMLEAAAAMTAPSCRVRGVVGVGPNVPTDVNPRWSRAEHGWIGRGDHPVPGAQSVEAARRVSDLARLASEQSQEAARPAEVIVLLSGGASALVCNPIAPLTIEDVAEITRALLASGRPIGDLNTVRRHLDGLKGGRLARRLRPARVRVLVLSDVIGDPLHDIASGPCAADPTTQAEARAILETLDLSGAVRTRARGVLADPANESLKPGDPALAGVTHHVIASNVIARQAAARWCREAGARVVEREAPLLGDAETAAVTLIDEALALAAQHAGALALVAGGETTVTLPKEQGAGFGGRNQHLALRAALELDLRAARGELPRRVTLLSMATDGVDGVAPIGAVPAAGAVVDQHTLHDPDARAEARERLGQCDSYAFFARRADAHLLTGPTGTNVNDVQVVWVE